jgi:hypothetical protein
MKTPFWKTYVAIAVLAGLGAYAFFVESKKPASDAEAKEKVFALEQANVGELTLARAGEETIRLVREADGWQMRDPKPVTADSSEVESLLSSLETLEIDAVVAEEGAEAAEYGLESPRLSVAAQLEGVTEPLRLEIGDDVPTGGGVYARLSTNPRVFIVPAQIESAFAKRPFDLRDRNILHIERDAVKTVDVVEPDGSYSLMRDETQEWVITSPFQTRAGRWKVDGFLGSLERLRMESVAAEEAQTLATFGLTSPVRTVTLGLADGDSRKLEIGSSPSEGQFHAREAGSRLVAVISSEVPDQLAKGMDDLRASRLLEVATYEVIGFEVEMGEVKQSYSRSSAEDADGFDAQKWSRTAPDAKDLETSAVQGALFKIGGLDAVAFIDSPPSLDSYGLDPPGFRLTLRYEGDKPEKWLELGQDAGKSYGRRFGDTCLLELDPAKVEELLKAFEEL